MIIEESWLEVSELAPELSPVASDDELDVDVVVVDAANSSAETIPSLFLSRLER